MAFDARKIDDFGIGTYIQGLLDALPAVGRPEALVPYLPYFDPSKRGRGERSTSIHTAWALLGLMSSGEVHSDSVRRGIDFLLSAQQSNGLWSDPDFNAPGFPRVFYLKYHGYDKYFPLLALARYRNLTNEET